MRNDVFRLDPVHCMSATVATAVFKESVHDPKTDKALSISQVKDMNDKAEFPAFIDNANVKMEIQSGQHRMKIPQQFKMNPKDH